MSPNVAGTTPYPWPYDSDLGGRATALLVVCPQGATAADEHSHAISELAAAVRAVGGRVILALTTPAARLGSRPADPTADVTDSPPELLSDPADHVIRAGGIDAFYASDLDLLLRGAGIRRLLLAGIGLETAIHSTMRDANDRGYECLLVVDACTPVDPDLVGAAVSMIEMSGGIFGAVGHRAQVLAALRQPANA